MKKRIFIFTLTVLFAVLFLAGCAKPDVSNTASVSPASSVNPQASPTGSAVPSVSDAASALSSASASASPSEAPVNSDLRMLFINVGRADSALVSYKGKHYLIDTGTEESFPALVRALRSQGVKKLDGVFLTHTHNDHIGGLPGILQAFPVGKVYAATITTDKKSGTNIVDKEAEEAGYSVDRLNAGDKIALASDSVQFNVIGPLEYNSDDDNDNSLVMVLNLGSFTALYTGDMQFAEEQTLLTANALSHYTLLKVGNHGNPDASSDAFIAKVAPQYAVISTNTAIDSDTPAPRVLAALKKTNSKVFVTQDAETGILAVLKSGKLKVQNYKAEASAAAKGVSIQSLDKKAEFITLVNSLSKPIDLSGWWIYAESKGKMFFFPQGTTIAAQGTLTVASGKNPGAANLTWADKNVWHNSKSDTAVIYDSMGNMVFSGTY